MRTVRMLSVLVLAVSATIGGGVAQASTPPGSAGRSPSVTQTYEAVFQDYGGLATYTPAYGVTFFSAPVMAGTSPSITAVTGGYEVAYQNPSGYLSLYFVSPYGTGSGQVTIFGMLAGTSPSITTLANGTFEVAFQTNTHYLATYSTAAGGTLVPLGMAPGTSPGITALSGGSYAIAFQANTNYLAAYSPAAGGIPTVLGMAPGTSPSIAGLSGNSFIAAFQANTGYVATYSYPAVSGVFVPGTTAMSSGTSPSIVAVPDGYGYAIAWTTNTSVLQTYVPQDGVLDMGGPAAQGYSPSIAAKIAGGPFEVAYASGTPGNTGTFSTVGSLGSVNTGVGVAPNTGTGIS